LKLKGDLYNYSTGVIDKSFMLFNNNKGNLIKNEGLISMVYLTEGIEFDKETTFNFKLKSDEIILSDDTVVKERFDVKKIKSKTGEKINLSFLDELVKIGK
jgi:hypothetical protein